jgi:hypothetical protein
VHPSLYENNAKFKTLPANVIKISPKFIGTNPIYVVPEQKSFLSSAAVRKKRRGLKAFPAY